MSGLLRTLGAVLRAALLAILDALGVEHAAQDVVANAGKIADAAAADEHDRVLLQVVAFTRDVRDDFAAVGQAHLGDLAKCRVRLLRGGRVDAGADAALLRVLLHRRNLGLGLLRFAALADQLVDSGHLYSSFKWECDGSTPKPSVSTRRTPVVTGPGGLHLAMTGEE